MSVQLDHSYKQDDKSVYQLVKVFSLNSGSTVTLSATSTQQSVFNLSSNVPWNFSRSYINFDLNLGTSTGNATLLTDCIPVDNIQLLTQSGSQLAALYNVQPFSRVVPALTTDLRDYLSRGPAILGATIDAGFYTNNVYCNPSSSLVGTVIIPAAATPTAAYMLAVTGGLTVQTLSAGSIVANSGSDKSYIGKQRIAFGGLAAASAMACRIPLKAFSGTILSMDRDYVFPQNLQLVVNWSNFNQYLEDIAIPTYGGSMSLAISYPTAVTITNMFMWAARQINSNLVARSMSNLSSGYEVNIPFTVCGKNSSGAAGLYSAIQVVTPGGGMCLKRIINIVASPTTSLLMANLIDNVDGHAYTTVQTFLDANPLQQTQLDAGNGEDDYEYQFDMMKGSVYCSLREFQINSFFVDNFSSNAVRSLDWAKYDDVNDGLVLGQSSKNYNAQYNLTAAGGNIFQYIVYLRRLRIDSNGVNWI